MNQQSQDIILAVKCRHIIAETTCIDRYHFSGHHAENIVFQPIKIHVNISAQCLKCFGLVPIRIADTRSHSSHNRTRTVNRRGFFKAISIIPFFDFCQIHLIIWAEAAHLIFCETDILRQNTWICHREFIKHIERRMGTVFFYWQYSCHICQMYMCLIL